MIKSYFSAANHRFNGADLPASSRSDLNLGFGIFTLTIHKTVRRRLPYPTAEMHMSGLIAPMSELLNVESSEDHILCPLLVTTGAFRTGQDSANEPCDPEEQALLEWAPVQVPCRRNNCLRAREEQEKAQDLVSVRKRVE
jgi:hypothetical protein